MTTRAVQLGVEMNSAMMVAVEALRGQPEEPGMQPELAGAALGVLICRIAQLQDRIETLERMLASTARPAGNRRR